MKDTFSIRQLVLPGAFALTIMCAFVGVVASFRLSETSFAGAAEVVRQLSFEGADFLGALRTAIVRDFVFCSLVALLSAGLFQPVVVGAFVALRSFFAGAAAGLAAKCLVFGDAVRFCCVVFASNFLSLPVYVLVFVSSVSFFARISSLAPAARSKECRGFVARVVVFFVLMCLAQLVQTAMGICVINIGR